MAQREVVDLQPEYEAFMRRIQPVLGIDLRGYKQAQMNRRLNALLKRWNLTDWDTLVDLVKGDPEKLREFKDYVTINVSEFFRGADKFLHVRDVVFPELAETRRQIRIWSAGCSIGSEAYTLAMMLDSSGLRDRATILATDIDLTILNRARTGAGYLENEVKDVPAEYLDRYFTQDDEGWTVDPKIRSVVQFKQQNLLTDAYPKNMDLIVCRNVVIYFTDEAKHKIYSGFHGALNPGGYVFVGGTEIMSRSREIGFESPDVYFYRRAMNAESGRTRQVCHQ
jgi:chemotaxis protein methyltransferase CheR